MSSAAFKRSPSVLVMAFSAFFAIQAQDITAKTNSAEGVHQIDHLSAKFVDLYSKGNYQDAFIAAERALQISESLLGADDPRTARSLTNMATIHLTIADYDAALPLFQHALAICESRPCDEGEIFVTDILHNLAFLYQLTGQYGMAVAAYQKALGLAEKRYGGNSLEVAQTLNGLAEANRQAGQYSTALPMYERALTILKSLEKRVGPNDPDIATGLAKVLGNVGGIYQEIGQYDMAVEQYKLALDVREKAGEDHPDTAEILSGLAHAYTVTKQNALALPLYERALAINRSRFGPLHIKTAISLNNLGLLYIEMNKRGEALQYLERALKIYQELAGPLHPETAQMLGNLAAVNYEIGEQERAFLLYQQALLAALAGDSPKVLASISSNLGEVYKRRQQFNAAIFYYKISVTALNKIRSNKLVTEFQASFVNGITTNYQDLAHLLVENERRAEAEQVLGMLRKPNESDVPQTDPTSDNACHVPSTFQEQEFKLYGYLCKSAQSLKVAHTELESFKRTGISDQNTIKREELNLKLHDRLLAESAKVYRRLHDIEDQLESHAQTASTKETALFKAVLQFGGVLKELHEITGSYPAIVYMLPSEASTTLFVGTKDDAMVFYGSQGRQKLEELAKKLRDGILLRDTSYVQSAEELYAALIVPIESYLIHHKINILMLYLGDPLRNVPFAALYDRDNEKYLIEKYAISLYTGTDHSSLITRPVNPWSAVALGAINHIDGFDDLPFVLEEVQKVVRDPTGDKAPTSDSTQRFDGILPGRVYLNEQFSRQRLITLLEGEGGYSVMHIASHFKLSLDGTESSFLLLGNGQRITLRELMTTVHMKLSTYDLVTLSACQTAVAGRITSKELEGLGFILQSKGAKAVLATLWNVQDVGTAKFMAEFYRTRGEERKTTKAEALREAQRAMLRGSLIAHDTKTDLTHPYYWAAFVLMGNWT